MVGCGSALGLTALAGVAWYHGVPVLSLGRPFMLAPLLLVPMVVLVGHALRPPVARRGSWRGVLMVPAALGAALGLAAGGLTLVVDHGLGSLWVPVATAAVLALAIPAGGIVFRMAGTPRPWALALFGPAGYYCAFALLYAPARTAGPQPLLLSCAAGVVGYTLGALAIGDTLPSAARLAVYALLLALVPAGQVAHTALQVNDNLRRLESLSVPLLVPDLPGYSVVRVQSGWDAPNVLVIVMLPTTDHSGYDDGYEVHVTTLPVPSYFAPPESCDPVNPTLRGDAPGRPCVADTSDLWHRETQGHFTYLVRTGHTLSIVDGGPKVSPEMAREAAANLRPVAAKDLAGVLAS
ncbi:hypothetical protein Lfu02_61530 [Longispora fulva]|nr:hypothetical protein Lfu02_61530 [Longispora fulva]